MVPGVAHQYGGSQVIDSTPVHLRTPEGIYY